MKNYSHKINRWVCLKPGFNRALFADWGFSPGGIYPAYANFLGEGFIPVVVRS